MKTLISLELTKLSKLITFRVMIIIYSVLMPAIFLFMGNLPFAIPFLPDMKQVSSFPEVWNYATYSASWLNLLVGSHCSNYL